MVRERTALEKRNKSMEESYYIYRTTWAEDWPQFCEVTFFRDLFKERVQNKFEIFSLFYPIIAVVLSLIIAIIAAIATKKFFVGLVVFVALALIVMMAYSVYFQVLKNRVKKLNKLIGHFYTKYGRNIMKDLYKKYRPDELPPQPERYYNLDEDQFDDNEIEGSKQDDAEEDTTEATEPTEATDTPAATEGIDLRLKQHDDVSTTGDDVINSSCSPGEAEEDEEGDSSGKSEQILSEEAEGDEADSNAETYVEAVTVIDAGPSDDTDPQLQRPSETLHDDVISDDDAVDDKSEIEAIFGKEDEQEEASEDQKLTLADIFDDFSDESDEDYREEVEDEADDTEIAVDEDTTDETVEDEEDTETTDEETVEEELDEAETEEDTDEFAETEEGGEENRLFPEGYNPTIAELRAALRALMSS